MSSIVIYTKDYCSYCARAKGLLTKKQQNFTEYNIGAKPELRAEMLSRSNGRSTVPQIFINGQHIGGCDDLYALEDQGKLNELLKGK